MATRQPNSFRAKFGKSEAIADTILLAIIKAALKWAGVDVGTQEERQTCLEKY